MLIRSVLILISAFALQAQSQPPKLPYIDWNACPGEGCTYGPWTARKPTAVYNTWKQGRAIAHLVKGDKVVAVTGAVITFRPGVIRMDRDLPELNLKAGDTILTYAYRSEGFSAVWFHGSYQSEFDISFSSPGCGGAYCAATSIDPGRKVWWAQVKLSSGRVGWVNMNHADFDGTCSLSAPQASSKTDFFTFSSD
jgi:hypothetical protein